MSEDKIKEQYLEVFNNFQADFIKLVKKYQRVYDLPINVSLGLNASLPTVQNPNSKLIIRSNEMWCNKQMSLKKG